MLWGFMKNYPKKLKGIERCKELLRLCKEWIGYIYSEHFYESRLKLKSVCGMNADRFLRVVFEQW